MADSGATNIPQLAVAQANIPLRVNELTAAASPASMYGIDPNTTAGRVFGWIGGRWGGFVIANGTATLTASTTQYASVAIATGAISFATTTTNWNDFTNYVRAYKITVGTTSLTYEDHRGGPGGINGGSAPGIGTGSVTSVALTAPSILSVGGSPITTNGTLALTLATQTANLALAGPSSGAAAAPTFRSLVEADLTLANNTTGNVSTAAHGFTPILPNDATKFLNGVGGYTVPAGAGSVTSVGITAPAAGITSSGGPITTSGAITLALANDLAAVEGLSATGIVRRTAADTWTAGTLVGLATEVTGILPIANIATGTPTGAKFVRDDGTLAVPAGTGGAGDALTSNPLSQFASTTSAQLAGVITDETGAGALVFATSPTLLTPVLGTPASGTLTNCTGLPVVGGGTGVASLTAYAPIFGGTTTTGAVQSGTAGTSGQVLTSNGAGALPTFQVPVGGGSLTNWVEAVSAASPNTTVPVVSFAATNAATNVDVVLQPKGTGAVLAQIPDGLGAGGNKRGASAVDWQTARNSNTQVASGIGSSLLAGSNNTSSGTQSTGLGGLGNNSSGAQSLSGGSGCAASAAQAVAMGLSTTASGIASLATGSGSTTRGITGARAHASGATAGNAQTVTYVLKREPFNASPTILTANGTSGMSATNGIVLPDLSTYTFRGMVSARGPSGADSSGWTLSGVIHRESGAGTTALVAAVTPVLVAQTAGASGWVVAITADTTLGALVVTVTGSASGTTRWVAVIETAEVVG